MNSIDPVVAGDTPSAEYLRLVWQARDALYARRRKQLSGPEIDAIRWWRSSEAHRVGDGDLIVQARTYVGPRA